MRLVYTAVQLVSLCSKLIEHMTLDGCVMVVYIFINCNFNTAYVSMAYTHTRARAHMHMHTHAHNSRPDKIEVNHHASMTSHRPDEEDRTSGNGDDTSIPEDAFDVEFMCEESNFGFSLRGGAEYGSSLNVHKIAPGGATERDGRLRVNGERNMEKRKGKVA